MISPIAITMIARGLEFCAHISHLTKRKACVRSVVAQVSLAHTVPSTKFGMFTSERFSLGRALILRKLLARYMATQFDPLLRSLYFVLYRSASTVLYCTAAPISPSCAG
jgi:hypothetical protein